MKQFNIKKSDMPVMVDDEDYDRVKDYNWRLVGTVQTMINSWTHRSLAQIIMNDTKSMYDHVDRNPLNNQKSNLRKSSYSQNGHNTKKNKRAISSKYKGVDFSKRAGKWRARIHVDNVSVSCGYFFSEIEAAKAYDKKAIEFFGEFALTNIKIYGNYQ